MMMAEAEAERLESFQLGKKVKRAEIAYIEGLVRKEVEC